MKRFIFMYQLVLFFFFVDKNFNTRTPTVNVVTPSVRKPLATPSKKTSQNRRLHPGNFLIILNCTFLVIFNGVINYFHHVCVLLSVDATNN